MPELTAVAIREVQGFEINLERRWNKSKPVFLVVFNDGSKLVVKVEGSGGTMMGAMSPKLAKFSGGLMAQVSPAVQPTLLTRAEINTLKTLPPAKYAPPRNALKKNLMEPPGLTRAFLEVLDDPKQGWYKMAYVENLRSLDTTDDNELAQVLYQMRQNRTVLFTLGQIVAIDLFIGNEDRFDGEGKITNKGNIVFQKVAEKYVPIGLDFFHFQERAANLYVLPPTPWGGIALSNPYLLGILASKMRDSLNEKFAEALTLSEEHLIPLLAVGTLTNGLIDGATKLRAYLVAHRQGMPSGAATRMRMLNWD